MEVRLDTEEPLLIKDFRVTCLVKTEIFNVTVVNLMLQEVYINKICVPGLLEEDLEDKCLEKKVK